MHHRKYMLLLLLAALCLLLSGCGKTAAPPEPVYEIVGSSKHYGIMYGDTVIADQVWDSIRMYTHSKGTYFVVWINEKYGLMDQNGNLIVEPTHEWTAVGDSVGDYLLVMKESYGDHSKYGYYLINAITGEEVYHIHGYDRLILGDRFIVYEKVGGGLDKTYGLLDTQTMTVFANDLPTSSENCIFYHPDFGVEVEFTGYHAFFLMDGTKLIPTRRRDDAIIYNEKLGLLLITLTPDSSHYTLLDSSGRSVLPEGYLLHYRYHSRPNIDSDASGKYTLAFLVNASDGSYGLYNFSTQLFRALPGVTHAEYFNDGMCAVQNKDEKWGYIDDTGMMVYDFMFEKAGMFWDGTADVVYQYRNRTVDKNGNIK